MQDLRCGMGCHPERSEGSQRQASPSISTVGHLVPPTPEACNMLTQPARAGIATKHASRAVGVAQEALIPGVPGDRNLTSPPTA
jgi:hypothetical protein